MLLKDVNLYSIYQHELEAIKNFGNRTVYGILQSTVPYRLCVSRKFLNALPIMIILKEYNIYLILLSIKRL